MECALREHSIVMNYKLLNDCSNTSRSYCTSTFTVWFGCAQELICYGFCRFVTHFMGILPIIFCFFRGKCCRFVSRISANLVAIFTLFWPFSSDSFRFFHLCTNIPWAIRTVNWKFCFVIRISKVVIPI